MSQTQDGEDTRLYFQHKIARLEATNAELMAALRWYEERARELANKERSVTYVESVLTELTIDNGRQARAAIAKAEEGK